MFVLVFSYFHRMIPGFLSLLYIIFVVSKSILSSNFKKIEMINADIYDCRVFLGSIVLLLTLLICFLFKPQHGMISCIYNTAYSIV